MKEERNILNAAGTEIAIITRPDETDYISLTDIAKHRDPENPRIIIANWMRNRSTLEFLGLWEQLHNPDFKRLEFDTFKNESGANAFVMTPEKWTKSTAAIGITTKRGRYRIKNSPARLPPQARESNRTSTTRALLYSL